MKETSHQRPHFIWFHVRECVSPQNSHVEALSPNVTAFGDEIKIK